MNAPYTFTVLRYIHDGITGEFINVGVVVHSSEAKFLKGVFTSHYGRLSRTFLKIDSDNFRSLMRFCTSRFAELAEHAKSDLPLGTQHSALEISCSIIAPDDSALQWSSEGGGFSEDLDKTTEQIFDRFVRRYEDKSVPTTRNDDDVWRSFKKPLDQHHVAKFLVKKKIATPDYGYEFKNAWQNKTWRLLEPISFDLTDQDAIVDKANRWLGRGTALSESKEKFQLYFLLGAPHGEKLRNAFTKARNLLNKIPAKVDFVEEKAADAFAATMAKEIETHSAESKKS